MMITRVAIACCFLVLSVSFCSETVYADQVDDVLAGLPATLSVEEKSLQAELDALAADVNTALAGNPTIEPQRPLAKETLSEKSWEVSLEEPSHAGLNDENPPVTQAASDGEAVPISLVPEPSTIALATGALVYFLVFFRRRYAF